MLSAYAVESVRETEARVRAGLVEAGEGEDVLMLRAAAGLAEVVAVRAEQHRARSIVVLAGPGDNGGDALHAAALLAGADLEVGGEPVQVAAVGVGRSLHEGGLAAAREAGVEVHLLDPDDYGASDPADTELDVTTNPPEVVALLHGAGVVVDGLLGIGGRPGLGGLMARLAHTIPAEAYVISVDLPSGADPEGADPLIEAVFADETVTFGMLKPVHLLPATEPAVGRLTVVDIGVAMDSEPVVERLEFADVSDLWPVPGGTDHKYTRGVVGVVAGSEEYPGAAVLTCLAAVEAGAGLVRYLGPERAEDLVLAACPEVVPGDGRVEAYVVGPGSPDPAAVRAVLDSEIPCVVDAGALDVLAETVSEGGPREAETLLTPHAGELARLLTLLEGHEVARERVESHPVEHARRAAELTGCAVLLKGATTVVVDRDPEVPVLAQTDAPAWVASAGAGDVLAGIAGTLLASGLPAQEAGALAALVHGVAADRANPGGPVRASAVARAVPGTVANLLAR